MCRFMTAQSQTELQFPSQPHIYSYYFNFMRTTPPPFLYLFSDKANKQDEIDSWWSHKDKIRDEIYILHIFYISLRQD